MGEPTKEVGRVCECGSQSKGSATWPCPVTGGAHRWEPAPPSEMDRLANDLAGDWHERALAAESLNTRYREALEQIAISPPSHYQFYGWDWARNLAREALAPDAGTEESDG